MPSDCASCASCSFSDTSSVHADDRGPVAQLDRAPASEAGGRAFESRPGHHLLPGPFRTHGLQIIPKTSLTLSRARRGSGPVRPAPRPDRRTLKSANGSMVESRSWKPKASCRHGDKGERNTSSLDESALLMEARQQDSDSNPMEETDHGVRRTPRSVSIWRSGLVPRRCEVGLTGRSASRCRRCRQH
jgi:hypothetical protein